MTTLLCLTAFRLVFSFFLLLTLYVYRFMENIFSILDPVLYEVGHSSSFTETDND